MVAKTNGFGATGLVLGIGKQGPTTLKDKTIFYKQPIVCQNKSLVNIIPMSLCV